MSTRTLVVLLSLTVAGCGEPGAAGGPPDLGSTATADLAQPPDLAPARRDPTDHPLPAQLTDHGGAPLDHPKVWTVVWKGDEALGGEIDRFDAWMLRSTYWTDSVAEYGIAAGEGLGVIVLPDAPPATIDYSAFDGLIASLTATHPADANTVFSFVVNPNTTLTADPAQGCRDFGGYHSETAEGVVYAVNLQCDGGAQGFDSLTITISHELVEAATDPRPITHPGWFSDTIQPGEAGDLCTGLDLTLPGDSGDPDGGTAPQYAVERIYSAGRAKAGNVDPCVPAPATPWFGAAISPDSLDVTVPSNARVTQMVQIEPFAYGAVGSIDWTIYAMAPGVSFKPSHGVSQAGDTVPVEVTVQPSAQPGPSAIIIFSRSKVGDNLWYWPLTIE